MNTLLKNKIKNIYEIQICSDSYEYKLSDTLIIEFDNFSFIQILVDYQIIVKKMKSINDYTILGDYDLTEINSKLILKKENLEGSLIKSIEIYSQGTYTFGSKFLDLNKKYIIGFCFGFDEIILMTEFEFENMLYSYQNVSMQEII